MNKYLRLINDVQDEKYRDDGEVLRGDSDVDSWFRWRIIAIMVRMLVLINVALFGVELMICIIPGRQGDGAVFTMISSFVMVMAIFSTETLYDRFVHGKIHDAVVGWCSGAYRDSEWFNGLDDDGKAHVIGIIESDSYNIINRRVKNMEPITQNLRPAIRMLEHAIEEDRTLLNDDGTMLDDDDRDNPRRMIALYESYAQALTTAMYGDNLEPIRPNSTDMDSSDEEKLISTIDMYNQETDRRRANAPRIKKYESMLRRYREALIHHPEYHAGFPTSQAISDAESLAYAGFTD